jgi:hypothetical protein
MDNGKTSILLRLFVKVGCQQEAEVVTDAAMKKIHTFASHRRREIEPYWKMPEYYEVTLNLEPQIELEAAFFKTMSSLASGWECGGDSDDKWAIWNPSPNGSFFSPDVGWASLEIVLK